MNPKNPKIPGKRPLGGKPSLDGTRIAPNTPLEASRKEDNAEARRTGHLCLLGEISGTTIENGTRVSKRKRMTGEINEIGGKTKVTKETATKLRKILGKRLTPEQSDMGKGAKK